MQLEKRTVRGNELDTKSYRKLSNVSYSDIKLFLSDRRMFYRKKILCENIQEKTSISKIIGDLIHCKVLEPQNYDNLFCTAPVVVTGQMGELAENLYNRTVKCMDENNEVTLNIQVLMEQAIQDTRFNNKGEEVAFRGKTFEKVVQMFEGSDAERLYKYKRANHGRTVISQYNDEQAQRIVDDMMSTSYINCWLQDTEDTESHNELPVVFTYKDIEVKSLIDRIVINHKDKTINTLDVKSTWDVETFEKNYLGLYYYIQAALYNEAAKTWAMRNNLTGYQIKPMKFICVDSDGYMKPLIYSLSEQDLYKAYKGFIVRSTEYAGLDDAIRDIRYGIETGVWNTSMQAIANNGNVSLNVQYT